MKDTRSCMGMHITVEITDVGDTRKTRRDIDAVFAHFARVDDRFSTYKPTSEISLINQCKIHASHASIEMRTVLALCEQTKKETDGYFDIMHDGKLDPSGLVKGWAIWNAALLLRKRGQENFFIDAGGDVQVAGENASGIPWIVGIRNPMNREQIIKVLVPGDRGIATSGTAERGQHIYNPHKPEEKLTEVMSISVIGPNVYEADRFATAAFAMGTEGVRFIERLPGFEAYQIDRRGIATYTTGFNVFVRTIS
jgi:thiamine biosynthesis lipoprotein